MQHFLLGLFIISYYLFFVITVYRYLFFQFFILIFIFLLKECGVKPGVRSRLRAGVVGGIESRPLSWPWMVNNK